MISMSESLSEDGSKKPLGTVLEEGSFLTLGVTIVFCTKEYGLYPMFELGGLCFMFGTIMEGSTSVDTPPLEGLAQGSVLREGFPIE